MNDRIIPTWLEPCKNLDEVKKKYPNTNAIMGIGEKDRPAIFLTDPELAEPGDSWIATLDDEGQWIQIKAAESPREGVFSHMAEEIEALKAALLFYARDSSYENVQIGQAYISPVQMDGGETARIALGLEQEEG